MNTCFEGQKITLIGLGTRTHVALARYLVRKGALVTISDAKPAEMLQDEIRLLGDLPVRLGLGGHREEDVLTADLIFVTPGAPRTIPCLLKAQAKGIPLSSEIELLFESCSGRTVGITGSSGKTTTTTLVGEMCRADGLTTYVGGNIGLPLIDQVDFIPSDACVVLELSSFQLEFLSTSPHVGAILNITPNHLDRHGSFERYAAAKWNLLRYQRPSDWAILGIDDPEAGRLASICPGRVVSFSLNSVPLSGSYLAGDRLVVRWHGQEETICRRGDLKLRGEHNVRNALAAAAVATATGVGAGSIAQVLISFAGVEHRLETVAEINGVRYVNDSIATSPERAVAALRSFEEPIVLIAGGRSKHLPLRELAGLVATKAKAVVLMGEMGDEIGEALEGTSAKSSIVCRRASSMDEAVACARELALPGDIVLLSPGGTSFDQFRDFEERGRRFKEIVRRIDDCRFS